MRRELLIMLLLLSVPQVSAGLFDFFESKPEIEGRFIGTYTTTDIYIDNINEAVASRSISFADDPEDYATEAFMIQVSENAAFVNMDGEKIAGSIVRDSNVKIELEEGNYGYSGLPVQYFLEGRYEDKKIVGTFYGVLSTGKKELEGTFQVSKNAGALLGITKDFISEKSEVPETDCEFDEKWNGKECIPDEEVLPNQYEIMYTSDGEKIIHFVDAYGNDKYTKDAKNYYDSYGQAAVDNPLRNGWQTIKETPGNVWDFFFKTELEDKEKELQRDIARETIREDPSDTEKINEKYTSVVEKIGEKVSPAKDLMSVPADSVKQFAKEAKETEFAEGAMIYIEERESGGSAEQLYQDSPEELLFGGIGGGVAAGLNTQYSKALLFSKYEEAYARYKIAKEVGRKQS